MGKKRNPKGCFKPLIGEVERMELYDVIVWHLNKLDPKATQNEVRKLNSLSFRLATRVLDGNLFVLRMR